METPILVIEQPSFSNILQRKTLSQTRLTSVSFTQDTIVNMVDTREPSGRAGTSKATSQVPGQASKAASHFPPRQSLDVSEEVNNFATILSSGLRTPTGVMAKWLGGLPSPNELGPNEHFAVGEYDDENGHRRSGMFVYEHVSEQRQARYPDWTHPRTPPMPPTVSPKPFNPEDFLNYISTHTEPAQDITDHQTSLKVIALNSVATGKIVLKRFAKTTGKVLEQIAVMPDYSTPPSGPSISKPFQTQVKETPFTTISLAEAQAREKARKANYLRPQTSKPPIKPLERRQIGNSSRGTMWEDFLTYQTPPDSQEEEAPPLSPPRIPEHINKPSRKPLPANAEALNLDKSLPETPSTDSLRRRTQMPPGVQAGPRPDILAVPALRGVVENGSRNAVVSQYGLVFDTADASQPEKEISWPGTPASFQGEGKPVKKERWWEFEGSEEEEEKVVDPTQEVWARMEASKRNGGGIRKGGSGRF